MRFQLILNLATALGLVFAILLVKLTHAQIIELPPLAKARDANKNNRIERNEAAGPLAPSFDEIDCDKSRGLDGNEIRAFFDGTDCPKPSVALRANTLPELPPLAKARDANNNNLIEQTEAAGPLAPNFEEIDCDRSKALDGDEIRGFFAGTECKTPETSAQAGRMPSSAAPVRAENEILFNLYLPRTATIFRKIVLPWTVAITDSTKGRIKIKFSAASLAPVNRQLRMVATGVADAGMGIHHFTRRRTVTARVSELPFAGRSSEAVSIAVWRTVQKFAKPSEYRNVELMGVVSPPPTLIFNTKKAITSLEDFRSLKILAVGSLVRPAKLLGAPVVGIPLPFAYEQFSRGVVDGTFSNYGGLRDYRLLQFVKHATPVPGGVGNTSIFLAMNKKIFASFARRDREAIMGVSGETFGTYAVGWDEEEILSARLAKRSGIVETRMTVRDLAELKKRWSALTPAWIADAGNLGIDGKSAIAFYRTQVAKIEEGR